MADPFIQQFSRDYALVHNTEIQTWDSKDAIMDVGLYEWLASEFGEPLIGMVDGSHYEFTPTERILSQVCAIPAAGRAVEPSALLIRR